MKLAGLLGPGAVVGALLLVACGGDGGKTEYITFAGVQVDPTCSYVVDELAVKFTDDAPPEGVLNVLSRYDARRIKEDIDLGGAWIVEVDPDDREGLRRALDGRAGVEGVEAVGFTHRPGADPQGFNPCGTPVSQSEVP
ncbi:MAG: hypothetical protein Q7R32_12480 [Dehalococcoidia bacterium]|nr:hypothetical protein [Dehalococcoidia bacterium]